MKSYGYVGLILLFIGTISTTRAAQVHISFSGETSAPSISTFSIGSNVVLSFQAVATRALAISPVIHLLVYNAQSKLLTQKFIDMNLSSPGHWSATFKPPQRSLGFYRVYAAVHLNNSRIPLPAKGSLPGKYLTYCIVPNPAHRPALSESESFFGMQGGFSKATTELLPLLGIRWVLGNLNWAYYSPVAPDKFVDGMQSIKAGVARRQIEPLTAAYSGQAWNLLPLPTLDVTPPKWLDHLPWDKRLIIWSNFCRKAGLFFAKQFPDLPEHVYQVEWEPNFKSQFDGTLEQLVQWQRVAYTALHSADPHAVVIGPTGSRLNAAALAWSSKLIDLGIAKYLDGWSLHPYTTRNASNTIRELQLEHGISTISSELERSTGHVVPIYSTEAGDQSLPVAADELKQARYLVESNVIMDGMGLRMSIAFYIADFKSPQHYGLYYNDINGLPFGSTELSPKPAAPAFAAMTYLLEGARPTGKDDLGPAITAYRFIRGKTNILVAWTTDNQYALTRLSVQAPQSVVYDWMGNRVPTHHDTDIRIGPNPIYIIN